MAANGDVFAVFLKTHRSRSSLGMFLPLEEMKRWLPRGFGEDKVYDTSIEEKLLQEIEQSREAQIANVNKLKNDPLKTNPNKEKQKHLKLFQVVFVYIPRKKNIHRDLKSAFEDFRGIINISPAVSGNKKMLIVKWQRSLKISSNYDRLLEMFQPFRLAGLKTQPL